MISDALAMTASVLNEDNPAAQLVTMVKKIQRDFVALTPPTDRASLKVAPGCSIFWRIFPAFAVEAGI